MKKNNHSRNDRGSVLLEFVLVLPLYMFLFGISMFLYELRSGELAVLQSNRMLAWSADDRNNDHDRDLIQAVRTRLANSALSVTSNANKWAKIMDSSTIAAGGGMRFVPENDWCRLYAGNVDPVMSSPKFYLGALNILSALSGKAESSFYLFAPRDLSYVGMDGDERDFNRASALICRRYTSDSPHPDFGVRGNSSPSKCPMEEVFMIAQDEWLRAADTAMSSVSEGGQDSTAYTRITNSNVTETRQNN